MPADLLEQDSVIFRDAHTNSPVSEVKVLFREAHLRRRRKRMVGAGLIAALVLSLLATLLALGGGGPFFGGPPAPLQSHHPSSGSAAPRGASPHSYQLPSDQSVPSYVGFERAYYAGRFHALLTKSGACAWIGPNTVLWPAGYSVRFNPTELVNPSGRDIAHEGEFVGAAAQIVGTASWPSAARCYMGSDVLAFSGPILYGKKAKPF